MSLSRTLFKWASRKAELLNRESIIHRVFGRIQLGKFRPFDDQIKGLNSRPFGMFVYNQRALFLGVAALFLATLAILAWIWPDERLTVTLRVLFAFWLANVFLTLLMHRSFKVRLHQWISSPAASDFPPLFDRYFHLDSVLVVLLILTGRVWGLYLDAFAFLLFANTVVYSTYIQGGSEDDHSNSVAFLVQLLITLGFLITMRLNPGEPLWFHEVINAAPVVGMCVITLFSVLMVSLLRSVEHGITQRRLGLLGRYEKVLSEHAVKASAIKTEDGVQYSERQFREQATKVLKHLCSLESPFWYHSACLWLAEKHQDRGIILLPGPRANFDEAEDFQDGLAYPNPFLESADLLLLHSLKRHAETDSLGLLGFRGDSDIPAAFVLLRRDGRPVGILAVYGQEGGPPLMREDEAFLRAFGSILSNTMEQWEGRFKVLPHKEMDSLFSCQTLDEVFPRAARILKKYLEAAACMVIFRPDPNTLEMQIVATEGFSRSKLEGDSYKVGGGQTGKSAETGQTLRWDYVPAHREVFDERKLKTMERAHGGKVTSWMAIPISDKQNYGVIKVVNSEFRCGWFTDDDQELGEALARRLYVVIEKFKHIEEIEEAKDRAQRHAAEATSMQARAEKFAKQRQEDLMIITHQLQGPLSSIIFTVRNMQRKLLHEGIQDERLRYVHALVEDALALSFGTFSTFAREAGKDTFFGTAEIDAPSALESLCIRLQKTNAKANLRFVYKVEDGFPILRMDSRVFTSVFYSLIHNAMKYADPYSKVILECSFERATGKAALKVKSIGEPITPQEKELIFDKYKRGNVVEQTGRYHSGVGLGLWVARELMTAIGGSLTLELSTKEPELSVFVVHVPMNA